MYLIRINLNAKRYLLFVLNNCNSSYLQEDLQDVEKPVLAQTLWGIFIIKL